MVNILWLLMIGVSIFMFIVKGDYEGVMNTITTSAESSIELLIAFLGAMSIWTGVIKLCEKSGISDIISKILSYPMKVLFPELHKKSKRAMDSIIMNISANILGLSDAATPFGIKAMEELQKINPEKDKVSDYMVTFLIVNASSIQLIPSTVISIRASLGAANPSDIIFPTIISTFISLIFGLISNLIFKRLFR